MGHAMLGPSEVEVGWAGKKLAESEVVILVSELVSE